MLAARNGPWPGARAERLHTGQAVLVACVAGCSARWQLWRVTRQGIGVSCPFHLLPPSLSADGHRWGAWRLSPGATECSGAPEDVAAQGREAECILPPEETFEESFL